MSNFAQNYEIKVERQLVSILVGVGITLIIRGLSEIGERFLNAKNKRGAIAVQHGASRQSADRQRVASLSAAITDTDTSTAMPGDYSPESTVKMAEHPPKVAEQKTAAPLNRLRQAIIWSEILKRKF